MAGVVVRVAWYESVRWVHLLASTVMNCVVVATLTTPDVNWVVISAYSVILALFSLLLIQVICDALDVSDVKERAKFLALAKNPTPLLSALSYSRNYSLFSRSVCAVVALSPCLGLGVILFWKSYQASHGTFEDDGVTLQGYYKYMYLWTALTALVFIESVCILLLACAVLEVPPAAVEADGNFVVRLECLMLLMDDDLSVREQFISELGCDVTYKLGNDSWCGVCSGEEESYVVSPLPRPAEGKENEPEPAERTYGDDLGTTFTVDLGDPALLPLCPAGVLVEPPRPSQNPAVVSTAVNSGCCVGAADCCAHCC